MKRAFVTVGILAVLAAVVLLAVLVKSRNAPSTLEFMVVDAQSGGWVWDLTARLQGRYLRGYYQSDAGPIRFHLTKLSRGNGTLEMTAPDYEPVRIPVRLKAGVNRLDAPVLLTGLQVPGLDHFLAFETPKGTDIQVQLRPVRADGKAILNHPCLPLWIGCTVSVEMKDGAPVREEAEAGVSRGTTLFNGPIEWRWDPAPETQFRYAAVIPGSAISNDPAPLRVVDYLIVVPDPRKIGKDELASLMVSIWELPTARARNEALEKQKGRLRYFTDTSWNVKAGNG